MDGEDRSGVGKSKAITNCTSPAWLFMFVNSTRVNHEGSQHQVTLKVNPRRCQPHLGIQPWTVLIS